MAVRRRVARRRNPVTAGGSWTASFYGYDGHGSVRMLTDTSGAVTATYTYDAFGILIHRKHDDFANVPLVGEEHDNAIDARSDPAVRRSAVF